MRTKTREIEDEEKRVKKIERARFFFTFCFFFFLFESMGYDDSSVCVSLRQPNSNIPKINYQLDVRLIRDLLTRSHRKIYGKMHEALSVSECFLFFSSFIRFVSK